jgi:hypothetical protein
MRQRPIDLAEKTIHERGEKFYLYGEEQKGKPAGTKLAELGWTRRLDATEEDVTEEDVTEDDVAASPDTSAASGVDVETDPVARYTASFEIGSVEVMTATKIVQWGGRVLSKGEHIPPDWPVDPREIHERLRRLAPILQTTKRNHPYFEGDTYPCEEPPDVREGYTHVEYWESEDGEKEGLWVFAIHEPEEPIDRDEVEASVWVKVKPLERVVEHFLELPSALELFR